MNYEEEQRNELEALSEIYYDEIQVISDKSPISFSIRVRPQPSANEDSQHKRRVDDDDDDESSGDDFGDEFAYEDCVQTSSVELKFTFPPKYPDEKPLIEIIDSQSLQEYELERLSNNLEQKAQENLGMVMVFLLVSDIIEWLVTKSESEAVELELEKERKQKEIEAEEKKRFDGTPVTEQTFLAWKAKFDAELLKAKLDEQKQQVETTGTKGLTGREMFESDRTLAESDLNVDDLDQHQIEALLQSIEVHDLTDDEEWDVSSDQERDPSITSYPSLDSLRDPPDPEFVN